MRAQKTFIFFTQNSVKYGIDDRPGGMRVAIEYSVEDPLTLIGNCRGYVGQSLGELYLIASPHNIRVA